jgi:hypothetical protein
MASSSTSSLATLLCPEVDLAVLDRDLATIRDQGLGIDRVDVAVLTRLGPAADPEQVRAAKVALEAVAPTGVLVIHAADQAGRALAASLAGTTILVGRDLACIEAAGLGGASLLIGDRQLVFRSRDRQEQVVRLDPTSTVPSGAGTDWPLAVAAAWAMGAAPEAIGARLGSLLRELAG